MKKAIYKKKLFIIGIIIGIVFMIFGTISFCGYWSRERKAIEQKKKKTIFLLALPTDRLRIYMQNSMKCPERMWQNSK